MTDAKKFDTAKFNTLNMKLQEAISKDIQREQRKDSHKIVGACVIVTYRARSGYFGNAVFEDRGNSDALVAAMKECVRTLLIEGRLEEIVDALNQTFRLSDEDSQDILHVEKRTRLKD